ncbi:hypothetical protein [Seonamhaeicola sp. ML3]|uniref:hypothetical protein n=1 Tax=Seonamhaeicola sp. ML3 TaxID=2937786 RepID=UPI00200C483F|nr:hypothetical protein [Seonamhaeicola sp. ML3]
MKNKILIALVCFSSLMCFSQKKITWEDLSKVTFKEHFFPAYDRAFLKPTFSDSVKALEGKLVTITGYFLNIDPQGRLYILSKGPMSSCFFCGSGGPETAIEIQLPAKPPYKTDDVLEVTGKLKLNVDDIEHFNYILVNCEVQPLKQ